MAGAGKIFAILILPVPVDRLFTYFIPENLREDAVPGKRVIVQFGARKFFTGIIYQLTDTVPEGITPKPIDLILDDQPIVKPVHMDFWLWMAEYYMCSPGDVMKTALPAGLRIESETKIELNPAFDRSMLQLLQQHEQMVAMALEEQESLSISDIQKITGTKHVQHLVKNLLSKGVAISYEEYSERFIPKKEVFIKLSEELATDENKLMDLMNSLSKKAPKQSDILVFFIHETTIRGNTDELPKKILSSRTSASALHSMIKKGIFIETEKIVSRFPAHPDSSENGNFTLTSEQQDALKAIQTSLKEKPVHLLHGVTSSGKTEIYIRLMQDELAAGRQVLYLLPEIALTAQIVERLRVIFGDTVGVYHHKFNYNEKIEIWNSVSGEINPAKFRIILGTRSALFLPFINIGLIIIDEEHDGSYKQNDHAPRYHARDSAVMLSQMLGAKVLMGTATPSVETYFNAEQGRYGLTTLCNRFGNLPMPQVKIINMSKEGRSLKASWYISSELNMAIGQALENKKQIILFQNRRGFVPILQCTQCGWIPGCKHCDISLTYHKQNNHLKCHLCGYSSDVPHICPICGNTHIRFMGFGTEKVSEEVKAMFPKAVVRRMDADTTRGKYAHQNILNAFEEGETDILVGTQMVSKGLDFERVSLVGILNADNLMHFPDFRSYERGYQILTQIMGRAGRHGGQGLVVLQTRKPDHPVIAAAVKGDFQAFYNEQIKERQLFRYPPFYRLIQISVQHRNEQRTNQAAADLKKRISSIEGLFILGPEEPIYGRVKQFYIRNILIKIPRKQKHNNSRIIIRRLISDFLNEKQQSGVRVFADADPV